MVTVENPFTANKTTDPEARDFARSVELFREGITLAYANDLTAAKGKIASAFLLDVRCARALVPFLPPGEPLAKKYLMCQFLFEMIHDAPSPSAECDMDIDSSSTILKLMKSIKQPNHQTTQASSAHALLSSKKLLEKLNSNPSFFENNSNINEGYLTRARVHALRTDIFIGDMRDYKKALKEVDTALKMDPSNTSFRARRAKYYYQFNLAPSVKKIFEECQKVVDESHSDARPLRHIYAIMSDLTLEFAALGTFDDAMFYFQKMTACERRQFQLYTRQGVALECQDCFTREAHFKFSDKNLTAERIRERKVEDFCQFKRVEDIGSRSSVPQKCRARCMNCDKGVHDGINKLSKCVNCKQVYYCSKECQKFDWKNHKKSCNILAEMTTVRCNKCNKSERDGVKKLSTCARCTQVYYCSRECQKTDWKSHKKCCKTK